MLIGVSENYKFLQKNFYINNGEVIVEGAGSGPQGG